jgi:MFS-type transporter involved in bile tolerance (Atg22 family)
MLLPFVIIQYPLGKVADRKFGEKELLLAGFAIMGAATYVMSTIQSNSVLVWGTILFITRIGASMIEVMSETYFFKQVKPDDSDLIGFFRNAAPMAYVVAPLVATLLLFVIPINLLFVVLSIVALAGFSAGARIKDTL